MPRAINYPPVMGAREKFLCSSSFQGTGEVEKFSSVWCECPAQPRPVTAMPMEGPNPLRHPVRSHLAQVGMGQGIRQQEEAGPSCHPCTPKEMGKQQDLAHPRSLMEQTVGRQEHPGSWAPSMVTGKCSFPRSCWALQPPQLVPTGPLNASKDDFEMLISTPGSSYCWRHTTGHG